MKAIYYKNYGTVDNLHYMEVEIPVVKKGFVLVEIYAASLNKADQSLLKGDSYALRLVSGFFKPRVKFLGSNIAGIVKKISSDVEDIKVGDKVFGEIPMNVLGGFAEYATVPSKTLAKIPEGVSFEDAASVPMAGITALQALQLAEVKKGSEILIYGASGGVGNFMVQIAKAMEAVVTAVVGTNNIETVTASGADNVIDYKKEMWDESGKKYDAILAVNGYNHLTRYRDSLNENGIYVISGGDNKQIMEVMTYKPFMKNKGQKQFKNFIAKTKKEDLNKLSELLKTKKLVPIIDGAYELKDIKDAFNHFEKGKKHGKIIIKVR